MPLLRKRPKRNQHPFYKAKYRERRKLLERLRDAKCRYDPLNLICASHNVRFIEFNVNVIKYHHKNGKVYKWRSHGCPVCVGLIRAKVQLEISRAYKLRSDGNRGVKYRAKRASPKTKIDATIIEARDQI